MSTAVEALENHQSQCDELGDYKSLQAKLNEIQKLVDEQAEDDGLWFKAEYATEAYLQHQLRLLHEVIERSK